MKGIALHVGRGTHREGLTAFPIWHEHAEGRPVSIANDHLRAREFIGVVDQMKPSTTTATNGVGRAVEAVNGPLVLHGILDGERLLHASVINRQVVSA